MRLKIIFQIHQQINYEDTKINNICPNLITLCCDLEITTNGDILPLLISKIPISCILSFFIPQSYISKIKYLQLAFEVFIKL
jgi:hypothetical protein